MSTAPVAYLATLLSLGAGLPGFQKKLSDPIERSAVVADILGQGHLSVLVAAGPRLHAFGIDGHGLTGFPVDLRESAISDLAAADLDGDRRAEIAVTLKSGKLVLISNGAVAPGFPIALEGGCACGPSFLDVTGDGKPELLQGDKAGKLHAFDRAGKEVAGFPVALGSPITSTVSGGIFKGSSALAVGTESGLVHLMDLKGRGLPGFPLATHFAVTGAPAFGDIDDDGRTDLVVTSTDYRVYAVDDAGRALTGFPVLAGFPNYGSPALADLDDDGVLDVAFASSDGSLYAVTGQGKALKGFPVTLAPRLLSGVAVGDLDRDGKPDLVVTGTDGKMHARSLGGGSVFGFPVKLKGEASATPFLGADRQGNAVAIVGAPDGTLVAAGSRAKGKEPAAIAWAGQAHDAARTGRFYPSPPRYKEVAVSPKQPGCLDEIGASWRYLSPDNEPEPPPSLTWFRDGSPVQELEGKRQLPPSTARKGERWKFEVRSGTRTLRSPEVTIRNSPPSTAKVRITPPELSRAGAVRVEIVEPAVDPTGIGSRTAPRGPRTAPAAPCRESRCRARR
ncbi:MAG: VCBS repeat-containing protein [Myxococcales bacterium]|nr:VCBS repeat-containing protein [Myxococcales bacterium]